MKDDGDGDGVPDDEDDCPEEPGPESNNGCPEDMPTDGDGDGVPDDEDNCPATSNPDQTNTDADGEGDACDTDDDRDGVPDDADNCPQTPNAAQVDNDGNGVGALCDPDEPQYNEASWQIDVPEGTENVTLQLEYKASSGSDTSAELELNDGQFVRTDGLEDRETFSTRELSLGSYEGETVRVNLSATGDASVSVRGLRVYQDSDGDGLFDYRESQRWTNPQGLGVSFPLDPADPDADNDGLSDGTEVTLKPVLSDAGSVIQVEQGISNPDRPDTDRDGLSDPEELSNNTFPFRPDSDGDGLIDGREIKIGTSPTDFDTDGDELTDSQELELTVMETDQIRTTTTISTNPTLSDTDRDGLTDREELEYISSLDLYQFESNPKYPDTDGDGFSDLEENKIGSDSMDKNTDDDQFTDARDPDVTIENRPPKVVNIRSENFGEYLEFSVEDRSDVDVEINAYYDNHLGSTWSTENTAVYQTLGDRYRAEFDGSGVLNEQPDKYWINVTDEHGNERVMQIEPAGNDANVALAGTAVVAPTASGATSGLVLTASSVAAVGLVAGVAGYTVYQSEYENPEKEVLRDRPTTGSSRTYRPNNPDLPTEITLPVGAYAVDKGVEHGFGWEHIKETTEMTKEEIGSILTTGEVITNNNKKHVIGDLPSGEEAVLTIIGGTLVTAGVGDTVSDPCGEIVNIEENGEHATRDGEGEDNKPIDDKSELRILIEDQVVKIIEAGGERYYIVQVATNRYAVLVAAGSSGYWILQTTFTARQHADNLYRTIENAIIRGIEVGEHRQDVVYDPGTKPDC